MNNGDFGQTFIKSETNYNRTLAFIWLHFAGKNRTYFTIFNIYLCEILPYINLIVLNLMSNNNSDIEVGGSSHNSKSKLSQKNINVVKETSKNKSGKKISKNHKSSSIDNPLMRSNTFNKTNNTDSKKKRKIYHKIGRASCRERV
mgnify:CR=1 FL=1